MLSLIGDIWDQYNPPKTAIVIPTNIGWKNNYENVMGAGLAKEASRRFKNLAYRYGRWCNQYGAEAPVVYAEDLGLILLPTKPLNTKAPYLSWRNSSELPLIEKSLRELVELKPQHPELETIFVPLVGCGNGGLSETDVLPLMSSILVADHFVFVRQPPS